MSGGPRLVLRVDGGPGIGAGHVMRCLALAEAWTRAGGCASVAGSLSPQLHERLAAAELDAVDASGDGADVVERLAPDAIVLDGYSFGLDDQERLRRLAPLLVVDDRPRLARYACDLLLDQNAGAEAHAYSAPGARQLLGARYALVRREIRSARRATRLGGSRVLVSLGGVGEGPREGVLAAVAAVPGAEASEARGGGDLVALLERADVAVCAAGVTAWELACAGVPMLLLVTAENQHVVLEGAVSAGCALAADIETLPEQLAALLADGGLRAQLATAGRRLVDGRGAERVAAALRERVAAPGVPLPRGGD